MFCAMHEKAPAAVVLVGVGDARGPSFCAHMGLRHGVMYVPQCVPFANGTCVGCPASQRKAEAHACACGEEQSVLCLSAGCVTRTLVDGELVAGYTCSSGTVSSEPENDDKDGVSDHALPPVTYTSSANLVPEPTST
jgi:hypothetical protein